MKRILFVLFLLVSLQSFGQFRDKCPDFTIRNKYIEHTALPFGQWDYSIRHRQYETEIDFGTGKMFMPIPPDWSLIPLHFNAAIRIHEEIVAHQDWFIQLNNRDGDTLFNTPNNWPEISGIVLSIGLDESMPRNKCTQFYGIGVGAGSLYVDPDYAIIFITKTKFGITHNSFLKFNILWNTNRLMDMYDDKLYWGLSYGWYLDDKSQYRR